MRNKTQNISLQEDNDLKKIIELVIRNYKVFVISIVVALIIAFLANRFSIPIYKISASLLIKEESNTRARADVNDFLNSNLFGANQNLQNELWVLKSSPVIEQTIRNLDLVIGYFRKERFQTVDAYGATPFKVLMVGDHFQPMHITFSVSILDNENFHLKAKAKNAVFQRYNGTVISYNKEKWEFDQRGKFGQLIETPDLAFVLMVDTTNRQYIKDRFVYGFMFGNLHALTESLKGQLQFNIIQRDATVIEIAMKSPSVRKGRDIINEVMNVYSQQNLDEKNHIASITIDYIEKQLGEISDSLSQTENSLQNFRSTHQLLNVNEQTTGIVAQYRDLQNQMAELVTRKRYYDYVAKYLSDKEDFSEMIIPASMGIQDPVLNNLMAELVTAQAQRSNLIQSGQEKNPLVQKLSIQIENNIKTVAENIGAVRTTTELSIDEMNKRIRKIEAEISRLPKTQRQLGGIERKYRLNDAIYNYLLEKRAEAKITQASNLPDNKIIEPAKLVGTGPVKPNARLNYLVAIFLGLAIPFGYFMVRSLVNNKIESQENVERLTEFPTLGKIMHNRHKTNNVLFENPRSSISESFRALRTNIEYEFKEIPHRVILITSGTEGEGKSFNALNLAMSYAHLNRRTILIDMDLRKPSCYFSKDISSLEGLSSFYTGRLDLGEIILNTPHEKLDYILSGPVPPNPMELLSLEKTKEMIDYLKDLYDYIIIDTSPLAQVSDAYLLMDHTDIKIVVARYNYTLKKIFALVMKDLKHKGINNVGVVLNDNRIYSDQYGYGYGYNKKGK